MPRSGSRVAALPRAVAAIAAAGAGAGVLFAFNPGTTHVFPPCPFHALTGLYCPGCGSTRALHALLHGHTRAAFAYNPLLVVSLPLLVYAVARQFVRGLPPRRPLPVWTAWAPFVVLVGFAVLRNLPWGAVRWMAPHEVQPIAGA